MFAATAYTMLRFEGATATVMRATPPGVETPVARVQLAPLFVLLKICPSVVPLAANGSASAASTKLLPPVQPMDHAYGTSGRPVGKAIALKVAAGFTERKSPRSVVARTTLLSPGATRIWVTAWESPRNTGRDQLLPPSVDFTTPMPVPSNGSPNPRYITLKLLGSAASQPMERLPTLSVSGCHDVPPSVVFQRPPPEKATYSTFGFVG